MENVIVCGGRVGRNLTRNRVWAVLDHLESSFPAPFRLVQGKAVWTDQWAGAWALERGHPMQPVPIDEFFDGVRDDAPFNRNVRMADHFPPAVCVGFPGGGGTLHMMKIAHERGAHVADVDLHPDGTWTIHWWPPK